MDRTEYLRQFHDIGQRELELLYSSMTSKVMRKGEHITVPGQVQHEVYFVKSGVQMSHVDSEHKTHVIAFTYAPNLSAIPESFFFQQPSNYFLTCLTDSSFDVISFAALQALFDESQPLERLFRKMTEAVLVGMINRHIELHTLSIEERYKAFCQRSPHLLQLVPHKYIASYLRIDPTNFSKLFNAVPF